jgi:hypothetical protein
MLGPDIEITMSGTEMHGGRWARGVLRDAEQFFQIASQLSASICSSRKSICANWMASMRR